MRNLAISLSDVSYSCQSFGIVLIISQITLYTGRRSFIEIIVLFISYKFTSGNVCIKDREKEQDLYQENLFVMLEYISLEWLLLQFCQATC